MEVTEKITDKNDMTGEACALLFALNPSKFQKIAAKFGLLIENETDARNFEIMGRMGRINGFNLYTFKNQISVTQTQVQNAKLNTQTT